MPPSCMMKEGPGGVVSGGHVEQVGLQFSRPVHALSGLMVAALISVHSPRSAL